ncbi:MAG: hypothetical protein JSW47_13505 [Phycisphaerales bacterium]|nr:MAG: hypothetical protein JSW47_13505 [Phycisphaerales bacterium]
MARNRGKKALYEVMSKARARQDYGKNLEPMHSKKTEEGRKAVVSSKAMADWRKRPRIAQFNAGRFEFSVPYQAAIALGLVLVLLLLGSYRLGQNSVVPAQLATDKPGGRVERIDPESSDELTRANMQKPASPDEDVPSDQTVSPNKDMTAEVEKEVEPARPKGKNAIVLAQSGRVVDLQPVVEHFAEHGIELMIAPLEGGRYLLRTVEQYVRDPAIPGTDGFEAKREIIRVGALYKGKAPAGLDTFAPYYFSDAYGMKVEE